MKAIPHIQDRLKLQQSIIGKLGEDAVDAAYLQYCMACKLKDPTTRTGCQKDLIPLTLAGGRCPYFTV